MATIRALLAEPLPGERLDRIDAELLLSHCLGKPRSYLYAWPEREVEAPAACAYRDLARQRLAGQPVAYLLGEREFWSLSLAVGPGVLVPRPETETLVEWALELPLPATARVADLGTGSGAIAVALAHSRPGWQLLALEQSAEALTIARENVRRHTPDNVSCRQSDWFSAAPGEQFDLVVSNPPYVAEGDPHLASGDLRFEPQSALVAGPDGLDAIETILRSTPDYLRPGGWLLVEHGYGQGPALRRMFLAHGFQQVSTRSDLAGQPRITGGRLG